MKNDKKRKGEKMRGQQSTKTKGNCAPLAGTVHESMNLSSLQSHLSHLHNAQIPRFKNFQILEKILIVYLRFNVSLETVFFQGGQIFFMDRPRWNSFKVLRMFEEILVFKYIC